MIIDEVGRRVLPILQFGLLALSPIFLLVLLAITPVAIINTRVKQMISVPLLTSLLYVPYKYCDEENGMLNKHLNNLICLPTYFKVLFRCFVKSFHLLCFYVSLTFFG